MQTNHQNSPIIAKANNAKSNNDCKDKTNANNADFKLDSSQKNNADFVEDFRGDSSVDFANKPNKSAQQNTNQTAKSNTTNLAQIAFLSVFWVGKCKKASGTMGSIAGVALGLPILYFSSQTLFLLAIFVGLLAIKQVNLYEAQNAHKEGFCHDESWIVIDEVVGVWIALSIACFAEISILGVASAFVLFRVFDICKPSLIGKIDKEAKGGLGVVGDDALAGLIAGLASLVVLQSAKVGNDFLARFLG